MTWATPCCWYLKKTAEREKQRIVKLDEYPDDPLANKAELSNVKQTFAQLQKTEAEMATADAVAIATKRTQKVLKDDYLTKKRNRGKDQRPGGKHRAGSLQNLHDRCKRPGSNRQGHGGWQAVH